MLYRDEFELKDRQKNPYINTYVTQAGALPAQQPNRQVQSGLNPYHMKARENAQRDRMLFDQMAQQAAQQQQSGQAGVLNGLKMFNGVLNGEMEGPFNFNTPILNKNAFGANTPKVFSNEFASSIPNVAPRVPSKMAGNEFLSNLQNAAANVYPDNPMMQQVAVTTAILESGGLSGKSNPLIKANNLFGIKASKSFPGNKGNLSVTTTEYINGRPVKLKQNFAANDSLEDSFRQFDSLISGAKRYRNVRNANDPVEAFEAMARAGYATDPRYAKKLSQIYSRHVQPLYR